MEAVDKSSRFDPDNKDCQMEIDDFIGLDVSQTINELRVENGNLKKQLEEHINKKAAVKEKVDRKEKEVLDKNKIENSVRPKGRETKVEHLVKWKEALKNKTICLQKAKYSMIEKYDTELKYLSSQMAIYVDRLKISESHLVHERNQVHKYKTAYEEQQIQTMACYKYLQHIKKKYEERILEQETLVKMMNKRMNQFVAQQGKWSHKAEKFEENPTIEPNEDKLRPPDEWGLQEKIEYLELKYINERRDRVLNRLLFENEQLRKMIENDFYRCSENHFRKRIKINEGSYVEYFRRNSIYNRLIVCERKRLGKLRNQNETRNSVPHSSDEINEDNTDSGKDTNSHIEEDITDNEDASTTTLSEGSVEECLKNLTIDSLDEIQQEESNVNEVKKKNVKEDNNIDSEISAFENNSNTHEETNSDDEVEEKENEEIVMADEFTPTKKLSEDIEEGSLVNLTGLSRDKAKRELKVGEVKGKDVKKEYDIDSEMFAYKVVSNFLPIIPSDETRKDRRISGINKENETNNVLKIRSTQVQLRPHALSVDSGNDSIDSAHIVSKGDQKDLKISTTSTARTKSIAQKKIKSISHVP